MPSEKNSAKGPEERCARVGGRAGQQIRIIYPEGPSLGHQRMWSFVPLEERLSGPIAELSHALLCASHGRLSDPQRCVSASYPGYLLFQDTCLVGEVRGIGSQQQRHKLYLQSVIDAHCSLAFAKLYLSRAPWTAVNVLDERVLPFYAQQGLRVERIFAGQNRTYCGKTNAHPYGAFLALSGIEHLLATSLPAAADNPFGAQFHQILDQDFLAPTLRTRFHLYLDTLQQDLDAYLKYYNCERPCPGLRTQDRTPFRAFLDGAESRVAALTDNFQVLG